MTKLSSEQKEKLIRHDNKTKSHKNTKETICFPIAITLIEILLKDSESDSEQRHQRKVTKKRVQSKGAPPSGLEQCRGV